MPAMMALAPAVTRLRMSVTCWPLSRLALVVWTTVPPAAWAAAVASWMRTEKKGVSRAGMDRPSLSGAPASLTSPLPPPGPVPHAASPMATRAATRMLSTRRPVDRQLPLRIVMLLPIRFSCSGVVGEELRGGVEGAASCLRDGQPAVVGGKHLHTPGARVSGLLDRVDEAAHVEVAFTGEPSVVEGVLDQRAAHVGVGIVELDPGDVLDRE